MTKLFWKYLLQCVGKCVGKYINNGNPNIELLRIYYAYIFRKCRRNESCIQHMCYNKCVLKRSYLQLYHVVSIHYMQIDLEIIQDCILAMSRAYKCLYLSNLGTYLTQAFRSNETTFVTWLTLPFCLLMF